ncbi:MAG: hypothetical protein ABSC06_28655 [Rhodopila sp.]|jgi:DNA-binding beta-propeller fold protein YncE
MPGSPRIPFIDPDTDQIAGTIDAGMVPAQVELASSISKLLAIDGKTARVDIVDLVSGEIVEEAVPFVPRRITIGPDGLTAALADPETGRLILIDLLRRQTLGAVTGPAPLQDMVFSADAKTLFLAGGNSSAVAVIDAATAQVIRFIDTGLLPATFALTRSPNGQRLFAQSESGDIGVIDLQHRQALTPIPAGAGSTGRFPRHPAHIC